MSNHKSNGFFANLKNDLPASVVVFLVAVPLCLGIALASGAPLFAGIISGIIGGIVVGILSGSPLGVSGPAAGLAVIVLGAINELDSFPTFLMAVVLAGVIQILFAIVKLGVIGYYFPSSVIKGMLSGIGIFIIWKQIPYSLGYEKDTFSGVGLFESNGVAVSEKLSVLGDAIGPGALLIAGVSLAILILWEQPFMKRIPAFRVIQGPLVAVAAGIGLNVLFQGGGDYALATHQVVSIPEPETLAGFFGQFTAPDFSMMFNSEVLLIAATIAVVASLETLLCVEATDKLDPQKRVTPTNRELFAQGAGNIVSGLIGGLPITQVIVRSSANIQSGGKTKTSAVLHGFLLLICAMTIPGVINMVPLASLAAILFVVGFKLAKPVLFKTMFKLGPAQFVPFIVTIVGILATDLLVGIGLGMAVAILYILWNNYRIPYHFDPKNYEQGKPIEIHLAENVTFLNKAMILHTLNEIPADSHVIIDGSKTKNMHPDVREIISDFMLHAQTLNIEVETINLEDSGHDSVEAFGTHVLKRGAKKVWWKPEKLNKKAS